MIAYTAMQGQTCRESELFDFPLFQIAATLYCEHPVHACMADLRGWNFCAEVIHLVRHGQTEMNVYLG